VENAKATEDPSTIRPATHPRSELRDLERISAEVRDLIRHGAASKNATAAQKFDFGDRVTELLAIQGRAEEQAALSEDNRTFLELCRNRLDELLDGNEVSRGTLVNYGKIARVFKPGHEIRNGSLPFSFAKTLSSLEDEKDRDHWYGQALLKKISVSQLQAELSSRRGRGSGITNGRKRSKAFVCAETKETITQDELKTMVTLYLPTGARAASREPSQQYPRGKAAREVASKKGAAGPPKLLRFRDMAALAAWIERHKQEYPQAGPIHSLSDINAVGANSSHAADAFDPTVNAPDLTPMSEPSEDSTAQ